MTVSILLDHQKNVADDGTETFVPYPNDDQQRFQQLVVDAIGFEAARGAKAAASGVQPEQVLGFSVSVDSMRFHAPDAVVDVAGIAAGDVTSGPMMRYVGIGTLLSWLPYSRCCWCVDS